MIRFSCPACKNVLQAVAEQAGATVSCPKCTGRLRVPAAAPTTNNVASAPPLPGAAPKVVSFTCPSCDAAVRVTADLVGAVVSCPRCQLQMKVPAAAPPAIQTSPAVAPPALPSLPAAPPLPPEATTLLPLAAPEVASAEAARAMRNPTYALFIVATLGLFFSLVGVVNSSFDTLVKVLSTISLMHDVAALVLLIQLMRLKNFNLALAAAITAGSSWLWIWCSALTHPIPWLGMLGTCALGAWAVVTLLTPPVRACFGPSHDLKPLWTDYLADRRALWMSAVTAAFLLLVLLMTTTQADGMAYFLLTDLYIIGMAGLFFTPFSPAERILGKWESKATAGLPTLVLEFLKDGSLIVGRGRSGGGGSVLGSSDEMRSSHGSYRLVDGKVLEINLDNPGQKLTERVVSFPNITKPNELVLTFEGETRSFKMWNPVAKGFAAFFSTEEDKKEHLIGRWEPIDGEGAALQFTDDGALIRGDGLIAKFRLRANDVIELYADDAPTTIQFKVMSLSRYELALTAEGQGKHYKRSMTFTEAVEKQQSDAAKESLKKIGKTAAMVAGGAVLALGAVAFLAAAASGPAYCPCGRVRPCVFHG